MKACIVYEALVFWKSEGGYDYDYGWVWGVWSVYGLKIRRFIIVIRSFSDNSEQHCSQRCSAIGIFLVSQTSNLFSKITFLMQDMAEKLRNVPNPRKTPT